MALVAVSRLRGFAPGHDEVVNPIQVRGWPSRPAVPAPAIAASPT